MYRILPFAADPYSQVDSLWRIRKRTERRAATARSETDKACMLRVEHRACSTLLRDLRSFVSRSFLAFSSARPVCMEFLRPQRRSDLRVPRRWLRVATAGRVAPDGPATPNLPCSSL